MFVGLLGWVVIGLILGFVVSKFLDLHGDDPRFGIGIAAGAAIAGAAVYTFFSGTPVTMLNPWSMLFAGIGAIVGLCVWHLIRSRFISHVPYKRRSSY